jgi:hypothetical protein
MKFQMISNKWSVPYLLLHIKKVSTKLRNCILRSATKHPHSNWVYLISLLITVLKIFSPTSTRFQIPAALIFFDFCLGHSRAAPFHEQNPYHVIFVKLFFCNPECANLSAPPQHIAADGHSIGITSTFLGLL